MGRGFCWECEMMRLGSVILSGDERGGLGCGDLGRDEGQWLERDG